jgi:5'-nucleotidase
MNVKILVQRIAAIAMPALLGACGGSDGVDTPAPPAALSIGGTAATGAAIANGTVTARCAAGATTTATAAANGS